LFVLYCVLAAALLDSFDHVHQKTRAILHVLRPVLVVALVPEAGQERVEQVIAGGIDLNAVPACLLQPGRARSEAFHQELNFFDVAGSGSVPEGAAPLFRFVDMPGYGYAKAPKDMVRAWRHLINDYLRGRAALKRVLVLIDSRHGLKDVDTELLDMLDVHLERQEIVVVNPDDTVTNLVDEDENDLGFLEKLPRLDDAEHSRLNVCLVGYRLVDAERQRSDLPHSFGFY